MSSPTETLAAFTAWAKARITGDEKGRAQVVLDRLFIAFGPAKPVFGNDRVAVTRVAADCLAECWRDIRN